MWLLALAGDLARRSKGLRVDWNDLLTPPLPIEVVEEAPRGVIVDRERQPPGSTATVEQHPDGVTITIPSLNWGELFRGPGFTIALAIVIVLWAWIITDAVQAAAQNGHVVLFTRNATLWPGRAPWFSRWWSSTSSTAGHSISATGDVLTVRSRLLVGTRLPKLAARRAGRHPGR